MQRMLSDEGDAAPFRDRERALHFYYKAAMAYPQGLELYDMEKVLALAKAATANFGMSAEELCDAMAVNMEFSDALQSVSESGLEHDWPMA
jgi:hypothetical protein